MLEHLHDLPQRKPERPPESALDRIEEAREDIATLLENGVRPLITVPAEHFEELLKSGVFVVPKEDLLSGKKFSFIAGTIGIEPYLPEHQKRFVLEVDPTRIHIEPRLTGADASFHGVVAFPNGIPASAFTVLGSYSQDTWNTRTDSDIEKPLH